MCQTYLVWLKYPELLFKRKQLPQVFTLKESWIRFAGGCAKWKWGNCRSARQLAGGADPTVRIAPG